MEKSVKRGKVGVKILLPIILLSICTILSGFVALFNLQSLFNKAEVIATENVQSVQTIGEISKDVQKMTRLVYSIAAQPAETQVKTGEEVAALIDSIDQALVDAQKYIRDDNKDEMEAFIDIWENRMKVDWETLKPYIGTEASAMVIAQSSDELIDLCNCLETALEEYNEAENAYTADTVSVMENQYGMSSIVVLFFMGIAVILVIVAIFVAIRKVTQPLTQVAIQFGEISDEIGRKEGDLTKRITVRTNDEIGALADQINGFIEMLQGILGQIVNGSQTLGDIVSMVSTNVGNSNANAQNVSAAMEELSATMQEISATLQAISDSTEAVDHEVSEIAGRTEVLNTYSGEMKSRATEMAATAQTNKAHTNEMIGDIVGKLRKAIEDSKSVEKVNELTDEILSISSQTNLLALNASIEAARAGEAGKGFAVVADEIRQLADSSRETANNIQAINELVTQAVHSLSSNSSDIISYIEETVLPDYDGFVESGKQYSDDAAYVSDTMVEFATMAEHLKALVNETVDSIEGISSGVEESARAVTSSAEGTSQLVEEMSSIDLQMGENTQVVGQLQLQTEAFKKF